MVLSKAIGGSLPLAVVVYRDDLDVWQPGAHAGTFRGNQLAMAAGTATLAYVRENHLAERARRLSALACSPNSAHSPTSSPASETYAAAD